MITIDSNNSMDKSKMTRKWSPVIENLSNFKNKKLIEHICVFCEWYSVIYEANKIPVLRVSGQPIWDTSGSSDMDHNNMLPELLKEIVEKIKKYSYRSDIICKSYNFLTGMEEYKLSNGEFIPTTGYDVELNTDQISEIFGLDYLKYVDSQTYRDIQIDKILE